MSDVGKLRWDYGHFDSYSSCFLLCDRLDEQGKIMGDFLLLMKKGFWFFCPLLFALFILR